MATSALEHDDAASQHLPKPSDLPKHGKRKTHIPKNVRNDLEKALLGVCEVWFKDIKPYLVKNNIKIHSNAYMEQGKGDEHKPCVNFQPKSHLFHTESKVAHERNLVSKSSQTTKTAVLQKAPEKMRSTKSVQTQLIQDNRQKSSKTEAPCYESKMRPRQRRRRCRSQNTVAPSHAQTHNRWMPHWIIARPCRPCLLTPNESFYKMYRSKSCDIPKLDLSRKSRQKNIR